MNQAICLGISHSEEGKSMGCSHALGREALARAISLVLGLSLGARAPAQTVGFNVPEEDALSAIPEFARQAHLQIVAPADQLKGIKTHAVHGAIEVHAALEQLLRGTGIVVASDDGHIISLHVAPDPRTGALQRVSPGLIGDPATPSPGSQNVQPGNPPTSSSSSDEGQLEAIEVRGVALKYRPDNQSSATGLALPLIDTPQAITVLTSNMLEVVDAQNIYEATDLIPGSRPRWCRVRF